MTTPRPDLGARAALLARVRAVLSADPPGPRTPRPHVDPALVRTVARDADLVAIFTRRATDAGMRVTHTTRSALIDTLRAAVAPHTVATVGWCTSEPGAFADACAAALGPGADWRAGPGLSGWYAVAVGVTDVAAAVAETGSLVLASGPSASRGGFLVPPAHVAIVPASRIVADLVDLAAPDAAAVTIVSGPSKTADIEGILITGVHGPRTVHALVVTDA